MLSKTSKFKLYYYIPEYGKSSLIKKFQFKGDAEQKFLEEYAAWGKEIFQKAKKPSELSLFSSSTKISSTRSARLGTTAGEIDLRQTSFNEKTALGLPLFVKLNGDISNVTSGEGVEGSALVKLGNALFGINKTYTTQGKDFEKNSTHQETSIVSTFMF